MMNQFFSCFPIKTKGTVNGFHLHFRWPGKKRTGRHVRFLLWAMDLLATNRRKANTDTENDVDSHFAKIKI